MCFVKRHQSNFTVEQHYEAVGKDLLCVQEVYYKLNLKDTYINIDILRSKCVTKSPAVNEFLKLKPAILF